MRNPETQCSPFLEFCISQGLCMGEEILECSKGNCHSLFEVLHFHWNPRNHGLQKGLDLRKAGRWSCSSSNGHEESTKFKNYFSCTQTVKKNNFKFKRNEQPSQTFCNKSNQSLGIWTILQCCNLVFFLLQFHDWKSGQLSDWNSIAGIWLSSTW